MVERVEITDKAAAMIVARLKAQHGALMFHQSGGCCDGSAPMCYPAGDFRVGPQDVLLGEIAGCKFYIGAAQFEYWRAHPAHHRRRARARLRLFAWKRRKASGS